MEAAGCEDRSYVRAHMANAFKYLSSLPVIFSGHFVGEFTKEGQDNHEWGGHIIIFYTWYYTTKKVFYVPV